MNTPGEICYIGHDSLTKNIADMLTKRMNQASPFRILISVKLNVEATQCIVRDVPWNYTLYTNDLRYLGISFALLHFTMLCNDAFTSSTASLLQCCHLQSLSDSSYSISGYCSALSTITALHVSLATRWSTIPLCTNLTIQIPRACSANHLSLLRRKASWSHRGTLLTYRFKVRLWCIGWRPLNRGTTCFSGLVFMKFNTECPFLPLGVSMPNEWSMNLNDLDLVRFM